MNLKNKVKRKLLDILEPNSYSNTEHIDFILKAVKVSLKIKEIIGNVDIEKVSLGENCNASWYLKEVNSKKASYPFDWIFSSPKIILDCLKTDFSYFLDSDLIIAKGDKAAHTKYHDNLFNHKNPVSNPEAFNYYERTVSRFLKLLNSKRPILFVCVVLNENEKRVG